MGDPDNEPKQLHVRWFGRVPYDEALEVQKAIYANPKNNYLILCEHPPTYTLGVRTVADNVLPAAKTSGATITAVDRGGDVTYHGPGQLVGYPILTLVDHSTGRLADTVAYVGAIEQLLIDTLGELGVTNTGRLRGYPGVWIDTQSSNPRKLAAVGVKLARGRTMHGFALNIDTDLSMFDNIVPCGITNYRVTSLSAEGYSLTMRSLVDAIVSRAPQLLPNSTVDFAGVGWRTNRSDLSAFSRGEGWGEPTQEGASIQPGPVGPQPPNNNTGQPSIRLLGRLAQAGVVGGVDIRERKPDWMRVKTEMGPEYRQLKQTMRSLGLVTVCEDAGCPNIYECWDAGTATFMIAGDRCTRACGFCLVDTRKPLPLDPTEPEKVGQAVEKLGLKFAVVTMVARDDLADGAAQHVAGTIKAIRDRSPQTQVEVLISDHKGDVSSLETIFTARPDVLNHNIETVLRLQHAIRPSANYARSLSVLARAKAAGLVTKSGLIVGMGETDDEVNQTLCDLHAVGVEIVTIGQYLRPTTNHQPITRWVEPDKFAQYKQFGESLGISHVESSPLTRSSYHAAEASSASVANS